MKRLRIWAKSFSLTQQFISLLFGLSLLLVLGLMTVVIPNIRFAAKQELSKMFDNLEVALEEASEQQQELLFLPRGSFVYEYKDQEWQAISYEEADLSHPTNYYQKEVEINQRIYRLYLDKQLVPNIEKGVGESVNLMNLLVVGLFMMGMLIWLSSLIIRLNRIRHHIRRVKLNQPSPLMVSHYDEIGAVSQALVEMEETLSKQSQEKEEMVQNISHDLKTPIATIKSYAEAILDGVYPYGTLEESVKVIQDHANRLEKKVKSLLLLNRYGYLAETNTNQKTNMEELIESVLISVRAIRSDIDFVVETKPVFFVGEEEPWRNVISNLIENALRYAKNEIKITLEENSLKVENDGPSIQQEELESLFNPYVKGKDGQFGLGLAIVKKVSQGYGYHARAYNRSHGVGFQIQRKEKGTKV